MCDDINFLSVTNMQKIKQEGGKNLSTALYISI